MRTILVFALLVAGICASVVPGTRKSRFITGPIEDEIIEAIEQISQAIRDGDLDPFYIKEESFSLELPVPTLFNVAAFLKELLFTGLSDIVINNMNFNLLSLRLNFELELPHLDVSVGAARGDLTLFGNSLIVEGDGRVDIHETIVRGEVNIILGIMTGISISDVAVDFNLGRITSNIKLSILGSDVSEDINQFITSTIPDTLREFDAELNELIAIILLDTLNENLDLR